jgi:hypothetical protein
VVETVPFYDHKLKKVVQIPVSELSPGCAQVKVEGIDGVVWANMHDIKLNHIHHPPFDENVMVYIREIEKTFREVHPIPIEEWANGFRRDGHPLNEIALWLYAGKVYKFFTENEPSEMRRNEIFVIIVTCMNTSRNDVRKVLPKLSMSDDDIQKIIDKYYTRP